MMLWLLVSCQGPDLEDVPMTDDAASGEITVRFSVSISQGGLETKARGDEPSEDIRNMYLIIFDENGYFVEACEAHLADEAGSAANGYLRSYEVTLHKTDKKRIIHFIANCPVDQIHYGHESEVIGNMYVTKGDLNETAYWYRMMVWYVMTEGEGENEVLVPEIASAFSNIPLLRNYACIKVEKDPTLTEFELESYAIYNTIDKGTVAPYCSEHHEFQDFIDAEGNLLTYNDHLESEHEYRGNTLFDVKLNTSITEDNFISPDKPTYMYERKISVRTDEEHKWSESPAHIIIKGKYNGGPSTFYKIDMVRYNEEKSRVEYYNILRNFEYTFTVTSISGEGYATLQEAVDNPAGNNLSGATDTQGYTNVSDGLGRIFVSYTDTTLVTSDAVKLRYKYIPSIANNVVHNDRVSVQGILDGTGSVLKGMHPEVTDLTGPWTGWSEITFDVQNVGAISHIQEIVLNVEDNINLHKTIRYRLQKPYDMVVECTPDLIRSKAEMPISVMIHIPDHLTENLFPLYFNIETEKRTLSPDASKNVMPVEPALSIIPPEAGKQPGNSYYFVKSLESYEDDYLTLPVIDGKRVITTHWLTNKAENASTVYVHNKYFNLAYDTFENGDPFFENLSFPNGVNAKAGFETKFTFYMSVDAEVTVVLSGGLANAQGLTTFTYDPTAVGWQELTLYTTEAVETTASQEGVVRATLTASVGTRTESASCEAKPMSSIVIPELTVRFSYWGFNPPAVNSVTPTLSVNGTNISYGTIERSRYEQWGGYYYTVVYRNVVIPADLRESDLAVRYSYHNGSYNTNYGADKKVSAIMTDPYIDMQQR